MLANLAALMDMSVFCSVCESHVRPDGCFYSAVGVTSSASKAGRWLLGVMVVKRASFCNILG